MRPGGDQEPLAAEKAWLSFFRSDADSIGIHKGSQSLVNINAVPFQVFRDAVAFGLHHHAFSIEKILRGDFVLERKVYTVKAALPETRKIKGGFAQGLGGQGSGVGCCSPEFLLFFDQRHLFSKISSLSGPL